MKRILILCLCLLGVQTGLKAQGFYKEIFFDDFSGTELNTKNWWTRDDCLTPGDQSCHVGEDTTNAPRQKENLSVNGGILTIFAHNNRNDTGGVVLGATDLYTSGEINSTRKWRYGKFEVRCRVANGQGFNSSAALLSGAPDCNHAWNEIDLFENPGHDDLIWTNNYHFDKNCNDQIRQQSPWKTCGNGGGNHKCPTNVGQAWKGSTHPGDEISNFTTDGLGLSERFNTYGVEWYKEGRPGIFASWERMTAFESATQERTVIKYSLNGVVLRSTTLEDPLLDRRQFYDYPAMPLIIGLNLFYDRPAAGGCGAQGGVGSNSIFPGVMEVDFVRVSKWIKCDYDSPNLNVCNYDIVNSVDEPSEGGCLIDGSIPAANKDCFKEDLSDLHWRPTAWNAENVTIAGSGCEFTLETSPDQYHPYRFAGYVHVLATNRIQLKPGFIVRDKGRFHGEIVDCSSPKTAFESETEPEAIAPVLKQFNIEVYPNPARERITVAIEMPEGEWSEISLHSMTGTQVYRHGRVENGSHHIPIDLKGLAGGVYFLKIKTSQQDYVKKIVRL